jgi:uncharacterized protein (TIGR03032 family)
MIQEKQAIAPFASNYTPQLPELLLSLNCTIALTTYQAGKLVFISPHPDKERLTTLPRTFQKPMGIAIDGDKMAIASKDEVIILKNSRDLAHHYPNKPNTYDSLWLPRITYYTGQVDMHDIAFGKETIYAVNTSFSCLCKVDGEFNFTPIWQPPFIDKLVSEDRCHLNGLVMVDQKPKYVTALGTSNTLQGWRENITAGGILMDVETNEVILDGLAMPHSPRWYNNELYLLLSASGELIKVNVEEKSYETVKKFEGFCRGLAFYNDYAFIGFSKLRKNSSTFSQLPFTDKADFAGIKVIHLPTQAEVGEIRYKASVDEIYEVAILPNMIRPNVLNTINETHKYSLEIPDSNFWATGSKEG